MNTTNNLNTHEQHQPKRANKIKTLATAALLAVTGAVSGQNSATIDPKYYQTPQSAFMIPNLPSGSSFNLAIKAWEPVYITIDGIDVNSGVFFKNKSPTRTELWSTIQLKAWDVDNRLINYKEWWINKVLSLNVNYQADIYDRTAWSNTLNKRPDAIWVAPGQSANLSAGNHMANYKRTNIWTNTAISQGKTDSLKTVWAGKYEGRTIDWSWTTAWNTRDTISVLEKPTITKNTVAFASTGQGVTYRFLKSDPSGSIHVADSTWTEVTSFVGDGNAKSVTLPEKSQIRVGTKVSGTNHLEEFNLPTFTTDFGTDTPEIEWDVNTFRHHGRELNREVETPYIIYDMTGRELSIGKASQTTIPDHISGPVIIKYTNPGNSIQTKKIIVK